jgi:Zn finger protein HypA/HybF involved in hydrogenase expression
MPMPLEYRDTKMVVMCNDCQHKSKVKFHIVGGKCRKCRSYNTTRIDDDKTNFDEFSDDVEEVDEFDGEAENDQG